MKNKTKKNKGIKNRKNRKAYHLWTDDIVMTSRKSRCEKMISYIIRLMTSNYVHHNRIKIEK